jgi:hypothetical protein
MSHTPVKEPLAWLEHDGLLKRDGHHGHRSRSIEQVLDLLDACTTLESALGRVGYVDNISSVVGIIEFGEQPGLQLPGRIVQAPLQDANVGTRVKGLASDAARWRLRGASFRPRVGVRCLPIAIPSAGVPFAWEHRPR